MSANSSSTCTSKPRDVSPEQRKCCSPCCVGNSPVVKTYFNAVFSSQKSYLERGNWMIGTAWNWVWTHNDLEKLHQMKQVFSYRIPKKCPFRHVWWFSFVKGQSFRFHVCVCVFVGNALEILFKVFGLRNNCEISPTSSQCLLKSVHRDWNWKVSYFTNAGWWTAKTSAPLRLRLVYHDVWSIWFFISFRMQRNDFVTPKPRNKRETAIYTPCTYTVCLFG